MLAWGANAGFGAIGIEPTRIYSGEDGTSS
jgi:hypothetical protein